MLGIYTYTASTDPADLYVGFGVHNDGTTEGTVSNFVVTDVVPEPSAWALMLSGIGALFYVYRIRRNAV